MVALGIDSSSKWLLVVSHSGRGVYDLENGNRIARDYQILYPANGEINGIGPLEGKIIKVTERIIEEEINLKSPDGKYFITGTSDLIKIEMLTMPLHPTAAPRGG